MVHTQHMHREDNGQTQWDDVKTQLLYGSIFLFLMYAGSPLSNNRCNMGLDPNDTYEIGMVSYILLQIQNLKVCF